VFQLSTRLVNFKHKSCSDHGKLLIALNMNTQRLLHPIGKLA
jgi:hypothetical protein